MFRYRHRLSKDIDIFVPDPQYLGFVSPRLSDTAADLTQDYPEQPGTFVKLQFEEGEVESESVNAAQIASSHTPTLNVGF